MNTDDVKCTHTFDCNKFNYIIINVSNYNNNLRGKFMKVKRIVICGLFAALCFIGTWLHIPISLGGGSTMVHLGTTMIFLTAVIIGKDAAFAGGIGCALFDATNPAYIAWVLPTLIIKGLTGYTAGSIAFARGKEGSSMVQNVIGFIVSGLVSLLGYFLINWFVFVGFKVAVVKMASSLITTALGIGIAIPLAGVIKPILVRSGFRLAK